MSDLLRTLYNEYLLPSHKPSPEYQALCKKELEFIEQLLPDLCAKDLETLQAHQSDVMLASDYEWFREDFRFGAALMRAALEA